MNRVHQVLKEKVIKQILLAEILGMTKSSVSYW